MNILSKLAQGKTMSFTSANDKISVSITDSNNGPVFNLADGSQVQFTTILQYYNVVTDSTIYNINDQSFDIANFKEKYFVDSDDVDRMDISEVEKYTINDKVAYRYIAG